MFKNDLEDKTPRRMMKLIVRSVGLAEDIDKIKPGRDPLTIMCVRFCIDAICEISCKRKEKAVFLQKHLSDEGRKYIEQSFSVICIEDGEGKEIIEASSDMQAFENLVFRVRNAMAHEGDYWTSQVFSHSDQVDMVSAFFEKKNGEVLETVRYETKIKRDRFIHYFVEAAVDFIDNYIKIKAKR